MNVHADSRSTLEPWHFFVLGGLVAATLAVVWVRGTSPANVVLIVLTVGAGSLAGLGLYRTLWPLVADGVGERTEMVGERTRVALQREKMLALRSIKELEFDHAMGKVSDADYHEVTDRLRARALGLIRQLDHDSAGYRDLIERELAARLRQSRGDSREVTVDSLQSRVDSREPTARSVCGQCGVANDPDARFCKQCGSRMGE